MSAVRHPIFARVYQRLSRLMERDIGDHRGDLLAGLSGRVLEVGAGNGYLRARAAEAARAAPVRVEVGDAAAYPLPLDAASFEGAVACLVLCTIPDAARALAELRRVLRPGGELRFMEHVRSGRPRKARLQERIDRSGIWPRVAGGCHCSRDTVSAIESAGFAVERVRSFDLGPSWSHTNPHMLGLARSPRASAT